MLVFCAIEERRRRDCLRLRLCGYAIAVPRNKKFTEEQIAEARRLIEAGKYSEAILLHRSVYPLENTPYMHETNEADLRECLLTPMPVFSFCRPGELREIRMRMAIALVEGRNFDFEPDQCFPWGHLMLPKAVSQNFWASIANYRNVAEWRQSGAVLRARIQNSCDGACDACQRAAQGDYPLAKLPSLPIHNCKNLLDIGCRCIATATKIKGIDW